MRTIRGLESMRYNDSWKVLADLITELRKKGEVIPDTIMNDLRSAKTMVHVLRADPSHVENVERIETYLENVEFYLISTAQEKIGSEFAEQWMEKLGKAKEKIPEEEKVEGVSRFVSGIPRGKCWVRVQVSENSPQGEIERLAEENGLSHKMQRNGYVLAYGSDERVKSFLESLRLQQNRLRGKTKKRRSSS